MKNICAVLLVTIVALLLVGSVDGAFTTTNSYTGFTVASQSLSNETSGITIKYRDYAGYDYVTVAVHSGALFVKPTAEQDSFEIDGTTTNRQMWFYVGLSNTFKIAKSPAMNFQIKCTNSVNNVYTLGYCN
jgi:hypothetical protein